MIVFDSSAIYKTICLGRTSELSGQYTSSLAFFEIGNIVWKNSFLSKIYSHKESLELLNACEVILDKMRISHVSFEDVYQIASDCGISFYDSTYVSLAKELKCPLATLDRKLAVKARSLVEILQI